VFFFFQKKKQKALIRFAEGHITNSAKLPLGWGKKEMMVSPELRWTNHETIQ
jgi:hypothetical protein